MYKVMKIYYDNATGEILHQSSYRYDFEPNFDDDYEKMLTLNNRVKESIGLLILRDGAYAEDFQEGTLIKIDVETLKPVFGYLDPENPEELIITSEPMSEKIKKLEISQAQTNTTLLEFMEAVLLGGM
ncbi:hypothetical protein [Robertmurraya siralis]|uniref:hypothetical protein n=1 Tax=Robertmurraya siralis TaxID=77777 RepID=UPI0010F58DE0|nr:hypothetical protein [Robertmurraya siralis]